MAGKDLITVTVCGGGNAAHVMAGLIASRKNTDLRILALEDDDAEQWTKSVKGSDFILSAYDADMEMKDIAVKLKLITKDPAKAIPKAELVILTVPMDLHETYLEAIAPHVSANMTIVGIPGQLGFEFQCFSILKTKAKRMNIINMPGHPWAGRIVEFGKSVKILSKEESMVMSVTRGSGKTDKDPVQTLQYLFGQLPELVLYNSFLEQILSTKSILNPPIVMAAWKNWDGKPFTKKPLFYQEVTEEAVKFISDCSDETVLTAAEITKQKSSVILSNVVHIFESLKEEYKYNIEDNSTLIQAIKTNTAFSSYRHPVQEVDDGKYEPDFNHRYINEDVPCGLVIVKGVAQLAKVKTPALDKVIKWCQEKMGKEYVVGNKLEGKDVSSTRAPQRYGFKALQDLIEML
ncbi:hypothetical protein SNE40_011163 [Patella caerulea]|uniref:Opine dehydrogenase domain-containing protein n=1 Tax=Patella caerulea TaxID=87958 RepID=A0AAN8PHH2_PATCE